jgi:hypothetical protein
LVRDHSSMNCGSSAGTVENPARPRISAPHTAATLVAEGPARAELAELGPERNETGMGCNNGKISGSYRTIRLT